MSAKCDLVKNAMLAVQRYPWEQGVCAQALWELGDPATAVAMAHDAVLRQREDGRLAVINENIAVTDPAANGEVVWRAYEWTENEMYREAAEKMLHYLMEKAPRTDRGILCHNEVSFHEGYSADQIWADSIYMAPPFLAVMGKWDEAEKQLDGYLEYLRDEKTGLVYHIYDAGSSQFVRKKLWATGNGWALLGIGRMIPMALEKGRRETAEKLKRYGTGLLDAMLKYQLPDGRFHDILDEEDSFAEGTAAMMMAAFIYRGMADGWLSKAYLPAADKVAETMEQYVDEFGIIHEVCGCPHFVSVGTSAESMAACLMMWAWKEEYERWHKWLPDNENLPDKKKRPFFDSVMGTWKVAGNYGWEEGAALCIAGEFVKSGVCYPFHTERLEEEEYHDHEHSFEAVVEALLQTAHPECFSLKGFEEYYSEQEREFLMVLAGKLYERMEEE